MLNKSKLRSIYSKIQTQLFYMIPEKWEKVYLYASIIDKPNSVHKGEMFFYYYPKGLLKKNPINVYEIPNKFNIDEGPYMILADKLYDTIKELRYEFGNANEKLWSNITISIENLKFNLEYNYNNLSSSTYSSYDMHIIWKYKYLNLPIESLSKRDKVMLEHYIMEEQFRNIEIRKYSEGIYNNNVHNMIEYNNEIEEIIIDKQDKIENTENNISKVVQKVRKEKDIQETEKLDKYELYKRQKQKEMEKKKNQILNF